MAGSGELITTTPLGAKAGFALLRLVVVSTGVKVWVQMELARWTILNGRTALEGYREAGPRVGRLGWINWLWIGMDFAKVFQRGGIIGGTAAACSVLHPQGLVPEGNEMITTLSRIYTDTVGPRAEYLFLVGAVAVLFSTLIGSTASVPRLWTNTLGMLGVVKWEDVNSRTRTIRVLTWTLPLVWACFFLYVQSPVLMVQIGGIGGGIFLVAVVIAVWKLRCTGVPERFRSGPWTTVALVVSSVAILCVGVYGVLDTLGAVTGE
ncbi:hypothetical protein [Streptomyces minutiscleroticus]|uniref:hypothetical protein n=1 Tax=Streptomyces minutiscleroticus TaxID=68238 RepID=UPI0033340C2E